MSNFVRKALRSIQAMKSKLWKLPFKSDEDVTEKNEKNKEEKVAIENEEIEKSF